MSSPVRNSLLIAGVLAMLCVWVQNGHPSSGERIVDFHSLVEISAAGTLQVTETIRVIAAAQTIKRGIYRDFPTRYEAHDGRSVHLDFRVVAVLRDGKPEPYHLKNTSTGKRVYIGEKNVFLPPGEYTYTLAYQTDRQLGFFDDFDELYWNVTGNEWQFQIERARVVIVTPAGAEVLQSSAYTGRHGETGQDVVVDVDELGRPSFTTSRILAPGEGLTVAVAWPKGFVDEPTTKERMSFLFRDQAGLLTAVTAMVFVLGYYFLVWLRVGKDPQKGTIVARFHPPEGLSPAATRYLTQMKYDNKAFAAAIVNMAVKGALEIVQAEDGSYTLKKTGTDPSGLSRNEKMIFRTLLGSRGYVTIERGSRRVLRKAFTSLKTALDNEYDKLMFKRNAAYLIPGAVITLLGLGAVVLTAHEKFPAFFMSIWLTIWSAGCVILGIRFITTWRDIAGRRKLGVPLQLAGGLLITLFALPFFGGWVMGFIMYAKVLSPLTALVTLAMVLTNVIFHHLLKAPTLDGRRLLDEIEGFARYLSVAEKDRLNLLNPPHKTPQLFQKYLPYAMALDVEQQWGEQFAEVLARMQDHPARPLAWYHSTSGNPIGLDTLTSDLGGSLAGAISSAATAPGSSSGSSGGGSSGGGGGGGGGGGW